MKITKFEDLKIWKAALKLVRQVYDITSTPKLSKDFVLRDQLRRAVISISANIVEGFEKNNNNEFIRYLKIAKGSLGETKNHLYIAFEVDYIGKVQLDRFNLDLGELANQIGSFINYLEDVRNRGQFIKTRKTPR